jgi:hypothetical protein
MSKQFAAILLAASMTVLLGAGSAQPTAAQDRPSVQSIKHGTAYEPKSLKAIIGDRASSPRLADECSMCNCSNCS